VELFSLVTALLGGGVVERRVSKSKAFRTARWIMHVLLIPAIVGYTLVTGGAEGVTIERIVVLLIVMAVGCWFSKGIDRFIGATGGE